MAYLQHYLLNPFTRRNEIEMNLETSRQWQCLDATLQHSFAITIPMDNKSPTTHHWSHHAYTSTTTSQWFLCDIKDNLAQSSTQRKNIINDSNLEHQWQSLSYKQQLRYMCMANIDYNRMNAKFIEDAFNTLQLTIGCFHPNDNKITVIPKSLNLIPTFVSQLLTTKLNNIRMNHNISRRPQFHESTTHAILQYTSPSFQIQCPLDKK